MAKHLVPSGLGRRRFIGLGLAGGAGLVAGGWPRIAGSVPTPMARRDEEGPWFEATIPELQALMESGELTSRELTRIYLRRIDRLNPLLSAVIETNPEAVNIATRRDAERRGGHLRGPLHGIPVLVKDNIATADRMQTTAGSLALVGSRVPADALVAARLREAGAVILGKANLSEWANFRGFAPFNGWSARGGFTRDPYLLGADPCGSSSGSAAAPAANLCAAAVGTETDGSIVCPAGNNLVAGIKPTVGLVAQSGIIPIAASQDTAGPMTRTITDAAILLGVLQSPFGEVARHPLPEDYTQFLRRGALDGARIGVDRRYFTPEYGGDPTIVAVVERALDAMRGLGATLIDTDSGDPFAYFSDELNVLLFEFKVQVGQYLAPLHDTSLRTLADLIAFNLAHCREEMKYFGQELFELSEATSGDLSDPVYRASRALCIRLTRTEGIDAALERDHLDAIVAPSYSFASSPAAVAGYPDIAVPCGFTDDGLPAGVWIYGGFLQEPKLLSLAYDLEQELGARTAPRFLGELPAEPPNAGICAPASGEVAAEKGQLRHLGTGKMLRPPR